MPIYAYRCETCGHAKDVLQKISDPVLTVCPSCGNPTFKKQVTAAGFQLKGSGWYVTDFRGDPKTSAPPVSGDAGTADGGKGGDAAKADKSDTSKPESADKASKSEPAAAPAAAKPAPAPSAPSSGTPPAGGQ